jgi:hypothetical protein
MAMPPRIADADDQAGPTELGHLAPLVLGEPALVLHHLAHVGHRALGLEELAHALAQHLLFFAESEIHAASEVG